MKKIIHVPYIDQTKNWPTGCESVTTVMLLRYLGADITVDRFITNYLSTYPMRESEGQRYGPNPNHFFAGSPYDVNSFGCYPKVIIHSLNKVAADYPHLFADKKRKIVDLTGQSMEHVLINYIDKGMPVIFWASIDLKPTITGPDWMIEEDGESTGDIFTWISNEHCMLLVGYDEENYYFNDPWQNRGVIAYAKTLVEKRHREQMERKVGITN